MGFFEWVESVVSPKVAPPKFDESKLSPTGKKFAAAMGSAVQGATQGVLDNGSIGQNVGDAADFLKTLSAAVVPFAKCIGNKVGWVKLVALVAAAASGGGSSLLVAAVTPHLIPCGVTAVYGQLGNSPFELAVKEGLAQIGKGQPGYIDPGLQLLLEDPKVIAMFTGGLVRQAIAQPVQTFALPSPEQQRQADVNTGLTLAGLAAAAILLR